MENDLQAIVAQTETILESVSSRSDWEQAKASISGPNGALTQIAKNIGSLAKEDRPVGQVNLPAADRGTLQEYARRYRRASRSPVFG